ncbi:hypothetical protein OIU74_011685 [Salix koriyanagi]|uniref:Uncharacterized protein n=1 Tax=Salix koriyanagi TaxID=2511006 RepID=A0A9Q0TFX7_9ROSI|nr:hypothetical protein OIU74_011685 [Salix koriyanagi]
MGGGVFYHIFSSAALVSLALYHLVSATTTYLKSPLAYVAKPYHPVSSSHRFKYLQLYLLITCLLIAFAHQTLISSDSDPLLKGKYTCTPLHLSAIRRRPLPLPHPLPFSPHIRRHFPPPSPFRSLLRPRLRRLLPPVLVIRLLRVCPDLRSPGQMRLRLRPNLRPRRPPLLDPRLPA